MFKINNQKLKFSLYFDKYKNSEISTIEIEIIYAICKEYFGSRIPVYNIQF